MNKPILDIGGLDKAPVDRGLLLRPENDGDLTLTVGARGTFGSIRLTPAEVVLLKDALEGR
jgi:hypothetical protein